VMCGVMRSDHLGCDGLCADIGELQSLGDADSLEGTKVRERGRIRPSSCFVLSSAGSGLVFLPALSAMAKMLQVGWRDVWWSVIGPRGGDGLR